ncbi:mitochondrial metal transporter [Dimargaris verticillata]|uniref:Mitochondrial metal transporter n=1 Tax=Dimargaris verticillata TaxID=2761393 RepID=A0A9W8B2K2_9FUNG|nr:mitochondrial metal transporter [Dimargaris verticillata]
MSAMQARFAFRHRHATYHTSRRVEHGGHGHGHDHSSAEEQEQVLKALRGYSDPGSRITLIGMASNILLVGFKGIGGWLTNSVSLMADAVHSFTDIIGDVVTLFTVSKARQPADARYPFGYAAAWEIGQHSAVQLVELLPWLSDWQLWSSVSHHAHAHAHALPGATDAAAPHTHGLHTLGTGALWIAGTSVVIKELLFRSTLSVARKIDSQVLVANAWHHRSDAYSSMIAIVAIVGAKLGVPALDPIGGLLVAAIVGKNGLQVGMQSLRELTDAAQISKDKQAEVQKVLASHITQNHNANGLVMKAVRVRKCGPYYHAVVTLTLHQAQHAAQVSVTQLLATQAEYRQVIQAALPSVQSVLFEVAGSTL